MIRKSHLNDLDLIIEYKIQMFTDAGVSHLLNDNSNILIKEKYEQLYREHKATHFLFEDNNKIISMAGAFIKDDIPYCFYKTGIYGFIGDMYTLPVHRKSGYARMLLNWSIEWLKTQNITRIKLLASEQGRYLYESVGFKANVDEMYLNV